MYRKKITQPQLNHNVQILLSNPEGKHAKIKEREWNCSVCSRPHKITNDVKMIMDICSGSNIKRVLS